MGLFSKKSAEPASHRIDVHFAQPMTVRLRQQQEQALLEVAAARPQCTARVVASGTAISDHEEPLSSDVQFEVSCPDMKNLVAAFSSWLMANGLARGSWMEVDGERTALGTSEYVLLRTRLAEESDADLEATVLALHRALGDGTIGWHEDVYFRFDGPVFVFNGDSARAIMDALGEELAKHPLLRKAELVAANAAG